MPKEDSDRELEGNTVDTISTTSEGAETDRSKVMDLRRTSTPGSVRNVDEFGQAK